MAIVGEKLKDYVINQINQRQKELGNITKSDSDLVYLNAKTAWVKLSSGVSLTKEKISGSLSYNYLAKDVGEGKELAEKYVLFGGTAEKTNDILNQRQGLGGTSDSYTFNPDFGVVPFPGIKDVNVRCLNRGSLKKAKIKLRVEDRYQLEIIDILYLRLGYTLFLEWGNSHYLDNSGNTQKTLTTLAEKSFFKGSLGSSYNKLFSQIENERKTTNGNYDGFIGKVSNFDWGFNEDGSYDINLELISLGDVIESLKSNVVLDYKTNDFINQTISGSGNITLTGGGVVNDNKTLNTLFSILYLWKDQNSDPIDFLNYKNSVNEYSRLATQFTSGFNTYTSYIGDILPIPTTSSLSISTNNYTITAQIGYHNQWDNIIHEALQSNFIYQTEYGFFNYGKPITISYSFDATSITGNNKKIITDFIINQPNTASGAVFDSSDADYTFDDFRYWVEYADVSSNGSATRDYSVDPNSSTNQVPIDQARWNKLVDNVIIKTLYAKFPDTSVRMVTQRRDNDGFGIQNGNTISLYNRFDFANVLWKLFVGKIQPYDYSWGTGQFKYQLSDKDFSFGNKRWYNRNPGGQISNDDYLNSINKDSFRYDSKYKTDDDWIEWPDKPHVNISIRKSKPSSLTSTSNPLRKFKDQDLFRLYTKNSENIPTFSYYMRFGAVLQVLKDEILTKVKLSSTSNYNKYPSIVNINNEDNPTSNSFVSYMQNKPNLTSFDISKCMVKSTITIPESGSSNSNSYKTFTGDSNAAPLKEWKINQSSANSMNVYLNFEFIGNILQSNTDKEGSISVYSFIKGLCDGINRSFANVNNLEPVIDESTNVLSIADSSNNRSQGGDSYQLNPYGFIKNNTEGSFVRKVDLKTAITPAYATMVTVGTTAGGYVKGVEATAFSRWNEGIQDRFKNELVPASKDADITNSSESIRDTFSNFFRIFTVTKSNALLPFGVTTNLLNDLTSVSSTFSSFSLFGSAEHAGNILIDKDLISKNLEISTEYFRAYSANEKDGGSIGFIPFNVGLKMDGISGIKIYNEILLNTRFLPQNYSDNLSFITTAVNHSLKDGDWETELKLTLIPTPKKGSYSTPKKPSFVTTTAGISVPTTTGTIPGTGYPPSITDTDFINNKLGGISPVLYHTDGTIVVKSFPTGITSIQQSISQNKLKKRHWFKRNPAYNSILEQIQVPLKTGDVTKSVHPKFKAALEKAFTDIKSQGLQKWLFNCGGIFAVRNVTNGRRLTNHAFGLAIDLNNSSKTYKFGAKWDVPNKKIIDSDGNPVVWTAEHDGYVKIVNIMNSYGIGWLGSSDPMHFSIFEITGFNGL